MAKIVDYISATIIIGFLTFVWSGLALKNIVLALAISVAVVGIFLVVFTKLFKREGKPYHQDRLALELAVKGPSFLIEILKSILQNRVFESGFNYICLENVLIYVNFKFGNVTIADMPNVYAIASKYNKNRVFLFAKGIERKALRLLESYGVSLTVVKIKAIYKLLKKYDKLPEISKQKYRFSLKELPALFLSKSNVKGLIFSGVILIATAFFTPLKIYYMVFGSISLLLALLSFTPLGKETPAYEKLVDLFSATPESQTADTLTDDSSVCNEDLNKKIDDE